MGFVEELKLKSMYKSILFIAIVCSLTSCFKERIDVNYNVDENKKIVISGWITSLEEPQFIQISKTVNYLGDAEIEMIGGAEVTLSDEENSYLLEGKEKGFYYLPDSWTPRIGDQYQLKVIIDGKEYSASHQMQPCPEIEALDYRIAELDGEDEFLDSLHIYEAVFDFQDFVGEGNAYYGTDYLKGSLVRDSFIYGGFADDRFFDGQKFEEVILSGEDGYFQSGDTAIVEFHSIGVETSDYLQDIVNEIYRGGPFDAPPANVRTNIEGGAIGYFIVSDAKIREIVID